MICFEKTGIPVFSRFSINFATFVRNISAMQTLFFWIDSVNNVLWSYLLVALLLGCAVWFTVRTRGVQFRICLLYTSPSPRDMRRSRMPSSA